MFQLLKQDKFLLFFVKQGLVNGTSYIYIVSHTRNKKKLHCGGTERHFIH